jgi:hypothetical protein
VWSICNVTVTGPLNQEVDLEKFSWMSQVQRVGVPTRNDVGGVGSEEIGTQVCSRFAQAVLSGQGQYLAVIVSLDVLVVLLGW